MKKTSKYLPAIFLTLFGLLTIYLSGSIIFNLFGMREKQGNYVDFVIWANFICGFIYLGAAYGFIQSKKWTVGVLGLAILLLFITAIAFYNHVSSGGIYKEITFKALIFRFSITTILASVAWFTINKKNNNKQIK